MSELLKFYRDQPNESGYTWTGVMTWGDDDLEMIHDFIQWLFPTDEPSRFNPDAPILTASDRAAFHSPDLQEKFSKALDRFRQFYQFGTSSPSWAQPGDHNLLRISRIIRSIALLQGKDAAMAFKDEALATARTAKYDLSSSTAYWDRAVHAK